MWVGLSRFFRKQMLKEIKHARHLLGDRSVRNMGTREHESVWQLSGLTPVEEEREKEKLSRKDPSAALGKSCSR
jgi:hypothetical protein